MATAARRKGGSRGTVPRRPAARARGRFARGAAAVALALLAVAFTAGAATGAGASGLLAVTAAEARAGYELPDVLVFAGSDTLSAWGAVLKRGVDYALDAETRTLRLLADLPDTTRLALRYTCLPLSLPPVYRRAGADTGAPTFPGFPEGAALVAGAPARPDEAPPGTELRVGGAKTFGITVGSDRDLSLEQSLRLNVSGNITGNVAVNAYLSDQNTPLVPEGDTEELRALDKVLVEIEGERVSATMGDIALAIDGGTLATVRRELSGARATARVGPASILAAGARLDGEFASVTIAGVDGKQGPYLLAGTGGAVVAGSERVWIDGEPMARGRDRDYIIDYSTGEIEFTERRPVSSDNEIAVDYEAALGDFARDIYAGRGSAPLFGGAAEVGVTVAREADDRSSPEGLALSDADVALLAGAGDDPSLSHTDGVSFVGAGEGDYVMIADGVFEYAGADSGDYDLAFERVAGGPYDYDYVEGAYVHVGEGEGDYRLGRTLPMPVDKGIVAADARVALPGGGSVTVEGAVSSLDRNTFSSLDDDDNLGNAQVLAAVLPSMGLGSGGASRLSFGASARRVGGAFEGIGRFREVTYEEAWELAGLELPAAENLLEGTASLSLAGGGRATVSYGLLERGDALSSSRTQFDAAARPDGRSRVWASGRFVELDYSAADSSAARRRTLLRAGAERALGPVVPSVTYAHDERSTDLSGERYDEFGGSLASSGRGAVSFRAAYFHRLTDRSDGGGWEPASTTRTQEYALAASGSERLTVDASVQRRSTDYESGYDEPGTRFDLASVRLGHRSFGGGVSGEIRYTVTSTEVEEKERYVSVEDGVEVTHIVSTGRYVPVTDLSAGTRWNLAFRPSGGGALPDASAFRRFLAGVSFETDVKLREMTTTGDRRGLYLLSPDVIQGPDTVTGELTARHVARYSARGGRLSVRLSLESRDALDRSYSNASDTRKDRSGAVEVKVARGRALVYRVRADLGSRDQRTTGAGSSYDVREGTVLAELTASPAAELELRLAGSLTRQTERLDDAEVTVVDVTPSATYRLAGRGALSISVTRADVATDLDTVPTHLAGGRARGVTTEWRLSGDYRMNRYLTGSVDLSGESRPGSDARHTLDMRVNAYF